MRNLKGCRSKEFNRDKDSVVPQQNYRFKQNGLAKLKTFGYGTVK